MPKARARKTLARLDHPRAARECIGDAAMDGPKSVRILLEPPIFAVFLDERVKLHRRPVAARCRQEPGEGAHRLDPPPRVPRAGHLVDQPGVDPVEERDVEHEVAVPGRNAAPQPRLDPPRDRVVVAPVTGVRRPERPRVAVDAQRDGPARRVGDHRGQLPARQPAVEEPRDVGRREAQILRRHGLPPSFEREHGDVQIGRTFAERHREVEIARGAAQQRVDRRDGLGAAQPIELVHGEHARCAAAFEGADQQADPVVGLAVGLPIRRVRLPGLTPSDTYIEGRDARPKARAR